MLKLQKSSLILILIIVVLTAGCVSIYTLGYTPGTVWHKAEDVKSGTFGASVNTTNKDYVFPANLEVGSGQVTAGSGFVTGGSSLTGTALTVASGGTSSIGGNFNITGNVGIGMPYNSQAKLNVQGNITAADPVADNHVATKKYVDDLIGSIEGEVSLSNMLYVTGPQNPSCPEGTVTVLRRWFSASCTCPCSSGYSCTTPEGFFSEPPSCTPPMCGCAFGQSCTAIASQWDAAICAQSGTPLLNEKHTEEDCENWGGEVVTVEQSVKICRFNRATCPPRWFQYKNWSTTTDNTGKCCSVNGHSWSNTAQETCVATWGYCARRGTNYDYECTLNAVCDGYYNPGCRFTHDVCFNVGVSANITQIGCY